jgi:hypothetical protein
VVSRVVEACSAAGFEAVRLDSLTIAGSSGFDFEVDYQLGERYQFSE